MQKFKSHKIVEAVKIAAIMFAADGSACINPGAEAINVSAAYIDKHDPAMGGYYVRYPDGYESWSPSEAFEGGYTAVDAYPVPEETLTTGQPKITGYRNLSPDEISLMNEIKALGQSIEGHCAMIGSHLRTQAAEAEHLTSAEVDRIKYAEPGRWLAMARTDFQTALMKLARAVAQPTTF